MKTVHVVVTTVNDGERDLFSDIVLITEDKDKAEDLVKALKKHTAGLEWLGEYDSAASFTRDLDNLIFI
jgi:hypothetical protein